MELCPLKKFKRKKVVHHKKGKRGGNCDLHDKKNPWENKIKEQVAAAMKKQKEEDKNEQKKETEDLYKLAILMYKLAILISAVQPSAASSNASNRNAATEEVGINAILNRHRGIP